MGLLTLTIKVTFRLLLGVPRHCELDSCATLPINSPIPIFLCAARLQDPSAMLNRAQSLYSVCSHTLGIAEPGNHCAWHPVTLHQNDVLCFIFIFLQGLYVAIIPRFRFLRRAQLVSNACAMPIICYIPALVHIPIHGVVELGKDCFKFLRRARLLSIACPSH